MRYYFRLSESAARTDAMMEGKAIPPIALYEETQEILDSIENDELSDWWGVYKPTTNSAEWADYDSIDEAFEDYYTNEGIEWYCMVHDC